MHVFPKFVKKDKPVYFTMDNIHVDSLEENSLHKTQYLLQTKSIVRGDSHIY